MADASPSSPAHRVTLKETSIRTPGLAPHRGQLALAWAGTDNPSHSLNVMAGHGQPPRFGDKRTLSDTAVSGAALAELQGRSFIAWDGTDPDHSLNVMGV